MAGDGNGRRPTVREQYEAFRAANPGIIDLVADRARLAKSRGYQRLGIRRVMEVIRWDREMVLGEDGSGLKVNNNCMALLSREVMAENEDLRDFFTCRELRSGAE